MQSNLENSQDWRARSLQMMQKRWVRIAGVCVAVVIVILIIVPFFVNADTFRPKVEDEMSTALGRKVTLGHLSFSLFSGSLVADNIAVADDPGFSSSPFLQAASVHIGVNTGAFLFHHQVQIRKFVVDSPQIHLISKQDSTWNYSSLGHSSSTAANEKQSTGQPAATSSATAPAQPAGNASGSSASDVTVGEMEINNGSVTVSSLPSTGRDFVYSKVNLTVSNLSYVTAMPFQLSADLPANGTLQLNGTAGPMNTQDATETPLKASLNVKHFDPVNAGVIPKSEGVSMVADIQAQVSSDGKTLTSTGKVQASQLQLSTTGSPAPQPVDLDYNVGENLSTHAGQVTDVAIHTGPMAAHMTGSFQMAGQNVTLNLHLSAPNLPVDGLEQLLPAVGIRLPSGSSLHGGNLTASLAITGTTTAPDIQGPVEIDNTQLAGFDLGSKIQGLKALSGAGNATQIRTVKANVNSTVPSTELSNIYADIPSLGTASGNGNVSAAGALNFQLVAKLTNSGLVGGAMSALGGIAGGVMHTSASNGIPLTITGTTSNPQIRANVGAMLKGGPGGLLGKNGNPQKNPAAALKGLLGR